MGIQEAGVQYIIDSVIEALQENPKRRFIYVETAFFWMWWVEQTQEKKLIVRELVDSGRLEIVGGAWSMNDEAAAHYHSIIDQFTWGFRRLNESLGECGTPKIGWQIDPFGHSRENAAIMAKMGFDGLFIGRIDYQDKVTRNYNKAFEMLWHTSENDMSDASTIFTCILYNTYSPPPGFCFDVHCQDSPIIDNVKSPEYNVPERVSTFLNLMLEYNVPYRSGNILVTMGNDFNYQYAGMNFKNMDKLIKHINEYEYYGSKFHAFYSTPSCYLKAVNDAGVHLPTKSDDFFPYSSDPESFWTGYFTSRPTQKRFERMGNNFLQIGKQILALSHSPSCIDISKAKEAMGVLQHHDAISGTAKAHVASDYARMLTNALKTVEMAASHGLTNLIRKAIAQKWIITESPQFTTCLLLNISSCPETESARSFVITIYNPLSRYVNKLIRFPVVNTQFIYKIRGPNGEKIPVQRVPLPTFMQDIPGRESNASAEIAFIAKNIPPLGFISYYVKRSKRESQDFFISEVAEVLKPVRVGYENGTMVSLTADGRIKALHKQHLGKKVPFQQNFLYYIGSVGNNDFDNGGIRASGAYIFRPSGTVVRIRNKPTTRLVKGPVVTEIQQKYNGWLSQVIRLYNESDHIEFQWRVGPIPFQEKFDTLFGKEVITRYTISTLRNNGIFYTDSNGREMLKRRLNYRPTWKVELFEPIAGNYYPVTTRINIKDINNSSESLSVITDRAEGGSSLNDGQIELMLHRRLPYDDGFGVEEALNEMAFGLPLVAVGSHYVILESCAKARMLVQEKVLDSWIFISSTQELSYEQWKKEYQMEFSGLKRALPNNVQILTLEPWQDAEDEKKIYLLRLENIMDKRADPTVVEVNIQDLFATFSITNIREMMLGGNIPLDKSRRLKWSTFSRRIRKTRILEESITGNITLKPMEIRTFLVEIKPLLLNAYNGTVQPETFRA